jgi:hypothetical protein
MERWRQPVVVLAAATAVVVALLWLVPVVGLVAAAVLLVVTPPWGRSLAERAVISGVVVCGVAALVFPRAGSTPITETSTRLFLAALVVAVLALRAIPALRRVPIPRPTIADGLVLALILGMSYVLVSAYLGIAEPAIVSGLYFSGWDNQAHFTTFANTVMTGSTTWPTMDGAIAWNQWYPSLHTTLWSIGETAVHGAPAERLGLLWPYVSWNAATFAACLGALAWLSGDLARRLAPSRHRARAQWAAIGAFGLFAALGSPAFLYNKGFTNYLMGVTVTAVTAYLAARSARSAVSLGWFLIPLGGVAIIGLYTPLGLGLIPSAVVVAVALVRWRLWAGIAWIAVTLAGGLLLALTQTAAVLGTEPGQSAADLAGDLALVGQGMAPFNVGAALIAPLLVAGAVVLLARRRRWGLAAAVVGPVLGALSLAVVFSVGADAGGVGRLQSYYVLKSLDAVLLFTAPLIAALVGVGLARALRGLGRMGAAAGAAAAAVIGVAVFGYAGPAPDATADTVMVSSGFAAAAERTTGVTDTPVGDAIVAGARAAAPYAGATPLLWDGSGTLPNLWVSSLTEVMSKQQNAFYGRLPQFPYDDRTTQYLSLALNLDPDLRIVVLWFRPSSGALLEQYVSDRGDDRVLLQRIDVPAGPLCPECEPTSPQ